LLAYCAVFVKQLKRQRVQTAAGLCHRLHNAEVLQAWQVFGHRYAGFAPSLLNEVVVTQELFTLHTARHAVERA
jgi:hypothetical protein